jgi:medium-chain acyl-[acyl-carrier-protein] hydrolase
VNLAAWREHTRGVFSVRMLPGDHFFLRGAQSSLLQALVQDLEQSMHDRRV